ncbi:LOW QUALITY PROTEIN: uncharacterized protein LOC124288918 [Haliotis rubra]|uniref:LOW QUALITY PROTEIN: uncharacterized protein LOC124288918 n=1 Tax=Haliotis rubra TaxID=36100 RepID=UPI001EE6337B|nr:LOW QUALITY PROTEIN: uncharacterized protein LOC124288918 [Haliotis rubra]
MILGATNMDYESDTERKLSPTLAKSRALENAIINNSSSELDGLLKHINVNLPLNDRQETALILAVKLSHIDMVQILLKQKHCDKNYVNISNCSPLDLALVTTFDNRLEPRHEICWQIVSVLLENHAEPVRKDAMMYVIRTALKIEDNDFIFRIIDTCIAHATSLQFHELLLQKLHRHQPMCAGIIDPFLQHSADFTVKLLKIVNGENLCVVFNSFEYYKESHWACRETKASVFKKLILYVSGAGWHYTKADVSVIKKICPETARWCWRYESSPLSLRHHCRVTVRRSFTCFVPDALDQMQLPDTIKNYILLGEIDFLFKTKAMMLDDFMF